VSSVDQKGPRIKILIKNFYLQKKTLHRRLRTGSAGLMGTPESLNVRHKSGIADCSYQDAVS